MKNILLASLLVASPGAFAASFDCQKASTAIEHKICDNERLSKLDEQLSSAYSSALKGNPENADTLKMEDTSKAEAKSVKNGNKLTLESFRAKYVEVDGEYYSTTSIPRGSSFLFTCASRIADDQVNIWKKQAAKEGKIDLFFEVENHLHTAMLNANFQKLNSDPAKRGICNLINAVP